MQLSPEQLQCRQAKSKKPPKSKRNLAMSDVVYTITVFHILAAVSIFGFMVFSVIRRLNSQD
jgi:hypothetical protein